MQCVYIYLLMKLYVRKREPEADCELTTYSSPLAQAIYAVFVVNCKQGGGGNENIKNCYTDSHYKICDP